MPKPLLRFKISGVLCSAVHKHRGRRLRLLAVVVAGLLTASCFGGGDSASANPIRVYSEPLTTPLIPSRAQHYAAARVVDLLFSRLTYVNPQGEVGNELAESLSTPDLRQWTIKVKQGQKFSSGEPVTAKNFVEAWKYGALKENAQDKQDVFSVIAGGDTPSGNLTGVIQVDDYRINVTLNSPNRDFPAVLSDTAYAPLPSGFYANPEAFGDNPIGNGPYTLEKWDKGVTLQLKRDPEYQGPRKAENAALSFMVYPRVSTAYNDLISDNLDVLDRFPTDSLFSLEKDLANRSSVTPGTRIQNLTIPYSAPGFGNDEEGRLRRAALSRAIDRESIINRVFNGAGKAADGFLPDPVQAYQANPAGSEVLKHSEEEARSLWAAADAHRAWEARKLLLYYNSNGPYKEAFEALANQIHNSLGLDVEAAAATNFSAMKRTALEQHQPVRLGWFPTWPTPPAYWTFQFLPGGSGNWSGYSSEAFNKPFKAAMGTSELAVATQLYQQAQQQLLVDLPSLPLYFEANIMGWSQRMRDVNTAWSGDPVYYRLKV